MPGKLPRDNSLRFGVSESEHGCMRVRAGGGGECAFGDASVAVSKQAREREREGELNWQCAGFLTRLTPTSQRQTSAVARERKRAGATLLSKRRASKQAS